MWWCLPSPRRHRPTLRNGRTARRSIAHQRSGRCLCRWSQGLATSGTATGLPSVAVAGAMSPGARRITTPVSDPPVGLVHDRSTEVVSGVAVTLVTAPAPARAALIPGVVWPAVTLTAVAVPAAGWLFQHWSIHDPPLVAVRRQLLPERVPAADHRR